MGCNYPIRAWKTSDKSIIFEERKGDAVQELHLPCGQCEGCKMERARQWAIRCVHEASLHEENCVITLTYNDDNLPDGNDLIYEHFQLFMKRLRKKYSKKKIRFFMCGEYGKQRGRPHFHACIFGHRFNDLVYLKASKSGSNIYTSKQLESLWTNKGGGAIGFVTVGELDYDSAGYIARYIVKKQLGHLSHRAYETIDFETGEVNTKNKEFTRMSLKPGIGRGFFDKWQSDIFPADHCVIQGKEIKPPKYYTKLLAKKDELLYDDVQMARFERAQLTLADNTAERKEVKEKVLKARTALFNRDLT